MDFLSKLAEHKWGVVSLFLGAAALVGTEVVPADHVAVRAAAGAAVGVVGVGGPIVLALLVKRFLGPKA